jgi:hypothetical protein
MMVQVHSRAPFFLVASAPQKTLLLPLTLQSTIFPYRFCSAEDFAPSAYAPVDNSKGLALSTPFSVNSP